MSVSLKKPLRAKDWRIYPVGAFASHAAAWDALNAGGLKSPLLSSSFVASSLNAFQSGKEKLAVLGDPAQPDAMCIMSSTNGISWATFQPSQAPIGFWLMRPGLDVETALNCLLKALPGFPLVAAITQQDPLLLPRPANSRRMLSFDYIATMHIELNTDYGSYWQSRGKNLRQNMRTVRNRLEKNGYTFQLHCITDAEQVAEAVAQFARMESSGWKGEQGTAVSFDSGQGQFYVDLLQRYCRHGAACIYYLSFNETVVAMDLCLQQDGTVIILKTTYDEAFSEYSPAMMLHQKLLRLLLQSVDFHRLEFYGKARDWQLRLTDQSRAMYHVNVYRWSWLRQMMQKRIGAAETRDTLI